MDRTTSLVFVAAVLFGALSILTFLVGPEPYTHDEFSISGASVWTERDYIGFISAVFTFSLFVAGAILAFDDQREELNSMSSILGIERVKTEEFKTSAAGTRSMCIHCGQTLPVDSYSIIDDGLTPLERVLKA